MKVIITGSSGFIGRNLIDSLKKNKRITSYVLIDIKTGVDVNYISKTNFKADVLVHLGAETSVFNSEIDRITHSNISGFNKIVEYCNENNTKLIYASSSSANNITSMYGLSKRYNEQFASIYSNNAIGIRFHNVYGNYQREDTLLGIMVKNKKVTLYNNGLNYRHFTHVDNIIECIEHYIFNEIDVPLINVCNSEMITVDYFVSLVQNYIDVQVEKTTNIRQYDKKYQYVDVDIKLFNTTYITVEQGLNKYFNHYEIKDKNEHIKKNIS